MGIGEKAMSGTKSMIQEENALRWGFLEQETDACAVVSDRMELVYMNEPARRLVPLEWFGRRCFEIFPTVNELCAFNCPTRNAVHEAHDILYCEEVLKGDGTSKELGVAVVPLEGVSEDAARALLLLKPKGTTARDALLDQAAVLRETVTSRFKNV
jgi:hypothetical protein